MKQTQDATGANRGTGGTKHWLLAAAIASVPLLSLARVSSAQYASPNDGHARDANNRVGSNGVNSGGVARTGSGVSANNIVYGNVTRGQAFRGPVGSTDPRAFRGETADVNSSTFTRDSSGAAVRGNANLDNTYTAQTFYGSSRGVAPPVGVVPLGTAGNYVAPTPQQAAITIKPGQVNNAYAYPDPFYTGEGGILNAPLRSQFGSNVLTGQTFQGQDQSLLLVSPLAGMREAPISELNGYFSSQTGRMPIGVPTDRFRASQAEIDRMRAELNGQTLNNNAPNNGANPNDTTGQQRQDNGLQIGRPAAQPFDSPDNSPLPNGVRSTNLAAQPLSNQARTGEGSSLVRPGDVQNQAVRDAQVTELRRRLDRFAAESGLNPTTPNGTTTAAPGTTGAPVTPGTPAAPGTPGAPQRQPPAGAPVPLPNPAARPGTGATTTRPAAAPAARPAAPARGAAAPIEVRSLAAGVTAPGLRQTLATAEQQMREGKFASALEQYDVAEQVAPNDPLIWLGKADAELGQSSYRTAEAHLRQAFNADRALLMGRYDLNSLIGANRVQVLRKDLTDIAQANPKDPMAPFLLAYLDYNTGNGPGAAAHLNEAERRAGRADPTIAQMRQHWDLKTVAPATATPAPAATTRPAAPPNLNK